MGSICITDRDANKVVNVVERADGKNALAVEMSADVEIGAVEIKNAATDTRAIVDANGALKVLDYVSNCLVPAAYDYISLGYTGDNLTSVVFKTGGAGGTTVSTLTLAYDVSDNLETVTKT